MSTGGVATARTPGLERRLRPEVLLCLHEPDDVSIIRAAAHLIGLSACLADPAGLAHADGSLPILAVYDARVDAYGTAERRLLRTLRALEVPLLCIAGAEEPVVPDEVLRRPFTPLDLLGAARRVQPELYEFAGRDEVGPDVDDKLLLTTHDLRRATDDCDQSLARAAVALVDILRLRDIETAMHCYRVHAYACAIAGVVAPEILDDQTTAIGFLLHDVGKLALPDSILQKPGALTDQERQLMQTHPVIGAETALRFLPPGRGVNVIRWHHERWDGAGYPDGIAASEVPVEARIFAAADALDALTSDRPYRRATGWEAALHVLATDAGTHFDPAVVAAVDRHAAHLGRLHESLWARRP